MRAVRIRIRLWEIRTQDAWRGRSNNSNNHLSLLKLRPLTPELIDRIFGPAGQRLRAEQNRSVSITLSSPLVGDRLCYLAF
jgi:hypothetical protein